MDLKTIRDDTKAETSFLLTMKDIDLHSIAQPSQIIPMVQARLAMAIVDKIMEKVGPELDRMLGGK